MLNCVTRCCNVIQCLLHINFAFKAVRLMIVSSVIIFSWYSETRLKLFGHMRRRPLEAQVLFSRRNSNLQCVPSCLSHYLASVFLSIIDKPEDFHLGTVISAVVFIRCPSGITGFSPE
ncbi:hypothetical protein Lal_00040309 [Lupinus albus]|nr:hypothetical protein Lal_00040309 [Lupinus albus]